jgi:uncharacterized membrane protein
MSLLFIALKLVHIVSATVLFGTGLGTAFQMWAADRTGDARVIAAVASNVVRADLYFTTPAIIVQPLTGLSLIYSEGIDPFASWLVTAYLLYALAGACWLPVIWIQLRLRNLAGEADARSRALPAEYRQMMRIWFVLGWPAFLAVLLIFWLMVTKPALW